MKDTMDSIGAERISAQSTKESLENVSCLFDIIISDNIVRPLRS